MNTEQHASENTLSKAAGISAMISLFALPISISALSILYPLTILLSLFNYRHWRIEKGFWRHPVILITALYFLLFVIGLLYSNGQWHDRFKDIFKHLWIFGAILLMPIFVEKKWRDYGVLAFLCAMTLTLIISYLKFSGILHWRPELGRSAVFNNYIIQNTLMAFAAILILDRYLDDPKKSWPLLVLEFFMIVNIFFMSEGRSGYITFAVLFCYLLFHRYRYKGLFQAILLLIFLGGFTYALSNTLHQRVNQVFSETEHKHYLIYTSSLGRRYAEGSNAWYLVKKSPWIGYGTGGIRTAYASLPPERFQRAVLEDQLDLDYFNVLLKFGLIGLAVVLGFFAVLWIYGNRLLANERFIAHSLILFFLVGCIANDAMNRFVTGHFFSLFIALCFAPLIAAQKSTKV